jgi:hypothetical protein
MKVTAIELSADARPDDRTGAPALAAANRWPSVQV